MQLLDGRLVYSATDLNNYLECGHLVALERDVAHGIRQRPEADESLELIAAKGIAHEAAYLDSLRKRVGDVVEIDQSRRGLAGIEAAVAETEAAMAAGARVIYQGTFFDGTFLGKTDFLLRVEEPCARWPWSYEVADTKLALSEKTYFIIQLSHYSEQLGAVQGTVPAKMHVVLGSNEQVSYRVDDFAAYYRHLKATFLARGAFADTYPLPVSHCGICRWSGACETRRERDDHLSLVAGMRRDQIAKLEAGGIATLAALAAPGVARPAGLHEKSFARLHVQAEWQERGRREHRYLYDFIAHDARAGFGMMPAPAPGDVYFDMEGDPLFEIGRGIEYLFGIYAPDDDVPFKPFWGTDRAGEKRAFEECVDFLTERRKRYPTMHVYHYAPYEKTKLGLLWQRHATREDEVDTLLRDEVLVDLYAVVRQSLVISQPSYSIKKLEPYYGLMRTATVRKGDDSVVMFERWLEDPSQTAILDDIGKYNEEDCISTMMLRDWLLERRSEYAERNGLELAFRPLKLPDAPCHEPRLESCKKCRDAERLEREEKKISETERALLAREGDPQAQLLGHLLSYHRREEKPGWWQFFDRCAKYADLAEFDREAIGDLEFAHDVAPVPVARSFNYTYRFPDQIYRLDPGDAVTDPCTGKSAGTIVAIDDDTNTLVLKRAAKLDDAAALRAVIPGGPVVAQVQKEALGRIGTAYVTGTLASAHRATADVLSRSLPHLGDRAPGARIQPETVTPQSVLAVVEALDRSYLVLQGPPGTGKTYTGARVIAALLLAGKRVGIMATAHKVIHNMLHAIEAYAAEQGIAPERLRGAHKCSAGNSGSPFVSKLAHPYVESIEKADEIEAGPFTLLSGNGWFFARESLVDTLDYLFIDEAGQMALAEALSVSPCARNLVLLGDPQQLSQVRQGVHFEDAGESVLEHLLGDHATIEPERGILLDTSYRMEPSICEFVSQASYDGRLHADPPTCHNRVHLAGATIRGLQFLPVEHSGNAAESEEEANAVVERIRELLGATFVRKDEPEAPLRECDILIVAPYNAQRRRMLAALDAAGIRDVAVGTVDKFQGQEAPVVFYTMASSSGADAPRSLDFLFDPNRFNVAISRAQCVSYLVASPALLDTRCTTPLQMRKANTLCRYVECAASPESCGTQALAWSSPPEHAS